MEFYAYKGRYPLGNEPCGSENRLIIKDLKTSKGAINRCKKLWGNNFRIYTFTNFFNDNTFIEINIRRN